MQGNRLTRLSPYINTGFPCDKNSLPTDLHKCWNHRETLSIVSRAFSMLNTNLNTIRKITIQHLMSEHFSDSISNRSAGPEKNTLQKNYIRRLKGYNNTDQLCDRESLLTDLPESWLYKEPLHNRSGLINHGGKIISVTYKEFYILSRPLKAMAQLKIQYIQKEVHILSRPREFQYMPKEVYILSGPSEHQPIAGQSITTQYTHREKDLPQLPSTLQAQDTHKEPATAISQALIASCKRMVDQLKMVIIQPKVYRRTRTMLKVRCTDF